jgi:hypothetical protein
MKNEKKEENKETRKQGTVRKRQRKKGWDEIGK